ncbi:transketolase family protein [Saliniramus fredricksonii]|uniref:Transketolase subunit B n=1 Tax=Saliniramus fredricksonii TaxID=1653334 RepID=A0ABY0K9K3_9HYPH|nr:transketolase C-terminal domain-containing protein [Saliniramus fredricksonii]SCC81160.1 transketolase subunit B [Saliniramus fredricksonii]
MSTQSQDQSEIFRGTADGKTLLKDSRSVQGTPAASMPAFILGEELADLADNDPRIVVATADLATANRTSDFRARHPRRFFDFGIAERNMITAAAGMASTGLIPYVATFAAFSGILAAEQIRTDCAYPKMPVRIVGSHSGMSMGFYGTSHHALEDIGMMRTVADLTIVNATDANHLRAILRKSVDHPGAMYIRLGRGRDPVVYDTVPSDFAFGRATRLRDGSDITIMTYGAQVRPSLDAAQRMEKAGFSVRVVDMHTIKPLDFHEIKAAVDETGAILTVEEHNVIGGLGSAMAEALIDLPRIPFQRHGVPDKFVEVGPPAALYAHYQLDAEGIYNVASAFLKPRG